MAALTRVAFVASSLLFACGSGTVAHTPLAVFPTTVYTGVEDTGAKDSVPVSMDGGTRIFWTASSPAIATVIGGDTSAVIFGVAPGTATVTATAGDKTAAVSVVVTSYLASDRMAGLNFYGEHACAGCHQPSGTPDITPSGIGKHSDSQIQAAVAQGQNPEGGEISIGAAAHTFPLTHGTPAYNGLVAYLRSLPPTQAPHSDK